MQRRKTKRRLLQEFVTTCLREGKLSPESIDRQIDSFLFKYESDSIVKSNEVANDETANEGSRRLAKRRLYELRASNDEEEDEDSSTVDPLGDEVDKDDLTTEPMNDPDDTATPSKKPQIDIGKFAGKVSRFTANYDTMLDVERVIVKRAKNLIEEQYNHAAAEEFIDKLREFGIEFDEKSGAEPLETPIAPGAAASGLR